MKINKIFSTTVMAAALLSAPFAHADSSMTPAKKKEIEKIIHDYLVTNPDVLIEASQALQKKQQVVMQEQARAAIAQYGGNLVKGDLTVAGNPKGDVTLVEFFDYQCVHCIKMKPVIDALVHKNPNLRVVFKEFPIFGKESEMASRVAIAAGLQGKYMALQKQLFIGDHHLDEAKIMAAAKATGLDMERLKKDMSSQAVTAVLDETHKLAESVHLMGTPAFVILSTPSGQFKPGKETAFIPGAASEATLQEMINKAAQNVK